MSATYFTQPQVNEFKKNGFIVVKHFCSNAETAKLIRAARDNSPADFDNVCFEKTSLSSWFLPDKNIFGNLARSEKVVNGVAGLMDMKEPVCHVQSKLMEKKPMQGGVWKWHQDFAYWKTNEFKSAGQMISVMVALTDIDKNSGCSKVIRGSHKLSALKHTFNDEENSAGADSGQVHDILETMDMAYVEMEAGDAIFFHSNLLHCAGENLSAGSCWSAISCYSSVSNRITKGMFTSWYTPIDTITHESVFTYPAHNLSEKSISLPTEITALSTHRNRLTAHS